MSDKDNKRDVSLEEDAAGSGDRAGLLYSSMTDVRGFSISANGTARGLGVQRRPDASSPLEAESNPASVERVKEMLAELEDGPRRRPGDAARRTASDTVPDAPAVVAERRAAIAASIALPITRTVAPIATSNTLGEANDGLEAAGLAKAPETPAPSSSAALTREESFHKPLQVADDARLTDEQQASRQTLARRRWGVVCAALLLFVVLAGVIGTRPTSRSMASASTNVVAVTAPAPTQSHVAGTPAPAKASPSSTVAPRSSANEEQPAPSDPRTTTRRAAPRSEGAPQRPTPTAPPIASGASVSTTPATPPPNAHYLNEFRSKPSDPSE